MIDVDDFMQERGKPQTLPDVDTFMQERQKRRAPAPTLPDVDEFMQKRQAAPRVRSAFDVVGEISGATGERVTPDYSTPDIGSAAKIIRPSRSARRFSGA